MNLRQDLAGWWDRQMAAHGTPPSGEMGHEVEKTLIQFCDAIESCLGWHQYTWLPLQQQLEDIGFRWEKFLAEQPAIVGADGELLRIGRAVNTALLPILDSRYKKLKLVQLEEEIRDLKSQLTLAAPIAKSSQFHSKLPAAVNARDSNDYRDAYEHA